MRTAWAALAAMCCCGGTFATPPADTKPDPAVINADNEFGLKLLKTLTAGADDNVAISPTSVAIALQIVSNGARGPTRRAMQAAMGLTALNAQNINAANRALQASLASTGPEIQLTIANSLWMWRKGREVVPSFTRINQDYYAAEIGDLAGAPDNANAWISQKTQGLITRVLPDKDYRDTVAVTANAIYFKGAWTAPFDPKSTAPGPFTTGSGRRITCPMMEQRAHVPYLQAADFRAIRLDYGEDRRFSMVILLPNTGISLGTVVAKVTPDNLKHWLTQLRWSEVKLSLPRFKASYQHALPEPLKTLGMGLAFDRDRADFSGIAPRTALSDVEHATLVQVDESGTTAAGATAITAVTTSVMRLETFSVDHPFFYAIVDDTTGALLFVGTLSDPT